MSASRKQQLGITLPGINQPIAKFPELAELADNAGFDSVWNYEFYRDAWAMHSMNALGTKNITLASGLAVAGQRTPFEMVNALADLDELSGGRMLLATSIGGPGFTEFFMGIDIDRPASRMKEYIKVLRLYWHHMYTGEAVEFEGEFYRFASPPFNPFGGRTLTRPEVPIYLGAVGPAMNRLVGRACNGGLSWLVTPEVVMNRIILETDAAALKAGRDPSEVDIATYVICSISDDREVAMRRARIQVGCYIAYPGAEPLANELGLVEERNAVVDGLMQGGPAAPGDVTSDELVKKLAVAGTPDEVREQIVPYHEAIPHLILHTPYVPPLTAEESEDAFRNIVATFGGS